jgi:hypothetical protein
MVKDLLVFATALLALTAATATTASAQATAPPAERFVLSGVVAYDDGDGKAWLQEPRLTGDRVVVVRRGDSVGPWRVTAILRNRVELQGPGGTVVVPLHNAGGTAVAASGAPAASAAAQPQNARSVPLGDPSRREPITQFMGFLNPGGAGSEASASAQTAPPAPRMWLPEGPTPPAPATEPPKTIYFGKGDPRRREGMRELFGPR